MFQNKTRPRVLRYARLVALVTLGTALLVPWSKVRCEQISSKPSHRSGKAAGRDLIQDIIVTGNHHVPLQKIMACIESRPGTMYDRDKVYEDVRRLVEARLLRTINVWKEGGPPGPIKIHFIVSEYPSYVRDILYKNAHHMKFEELNELTGLCKGAAMIPSRNRQLCEIIREHYEEQGRLWAAVSLDEGERAQDTRVVFRIQEGPRAVVRGIDFRGNHLFTDQQLTKRVGAFPVFNAKAADLGKERLRQWYRAHGFADVNVEFQLKKEKHCGAVYLLFSIEEGPRYRVGDIQIQGGKKKDRQTLCQLVPVRLGEYYSERKAKQGEEKIQKAIRRPRKSPAVRMDWYPRTSKAPNQELVLVYEITEKKPPLRIGKIIISGNKTITDQAILRQIQLRPGSIVSGRKLSIAAKKLQKLFPHGTMEVRFQMECRPYQSGNGLRPLSIAALDLLITVQEREMVPAIPTAQHRRKDAAGFPRPCDPHIKK